MGPQKNHMVVFNEALPGSFVPFSDGFLMIFIYLYYALEVFTASSTP